MSTDLAALDDLAARAEARLAARDQPVTTSTGLPSLHDIYVAPIPVESFVSIAPNTVLLSPLKKPQRASQGGLITSARAEDTPPTGCVAYVVVGVADVVATPDAPTFLPVEPGDVVLVRNMVLEPLSPSQEPLSCHRSGVLAKIALSDVRFAPPAKE